MNEIEKIEQEVKNININELYEAFKEIPFGNSDFQNRYFVVNSQLTPARAFRAVCLRLRDRIRALMEAYYELQKENIDIEEMEEKVKTEANKYEEMRLEIEIEKKKMQRIDTEKLVQDAIHETKYLLKLYEELPHPKREEFEAEELEHFEKYLKVQLLPNGALQSLLAIGKQVDDKLQLHDAAPDWKFDIFEKIKKLKGK